jgi:hypothetical protein
MCRTADLESEAGAQFLLVVIVAHILDGISYDIPPSPYNHSGCSFARLYQFLNSLSSSSEKVLCTMGFRLMRFTFLSVFFIFIPRLNYQIFQVNN